MGGRVGSAPRGSSFRGLRRTLLLMVHELHRQGYERLRIAPGTWEEIRVHKPEIVQELRGVVRVMHGGAAISPVQEPDDAPSSGGSRLRAQGLVKSYRKRKVVNDVAISVSQGEIVGLLGPNGAGKTTTFYMMVGLISPDAGRVYLDEADITETPMYQRARRGVGAPGHSLVARGRCPCWRGRRSTSPMRSWSTREWARRIR